MTYLNEAEAKSVVSQIEAMGSKAMALQLDTGNIKTFGAFVAWVQQSQQTEQFDSLVNNAGIGIYAPFTETTEEAFEQENLTDAKHSPTDESNGR